MTTAAGKAMLTERASIMRHGADPLPEGRYIDRHGEVHDGDTAPCKVELWRCHWGDCPGADKARAAAQGRRGA